MSNLFFPVLVLAAVSIFYPESGEAKALVQSREKRVPGQYSPRLGRRSQQIYDSNKLEEIMSLDPRMKEEYKKLFIKLFEEQLEKNPTVGENFFFYPRSGRAMNFFHWPRGGKRMDGGLDDTCCAKGIMLESGPEGKHNYCPGVKCCDGLSMRIGETEKTVAVVCVPEFGEIDHAES